MSDDFRKPLSIAQGAWQRENDAGKAHACGCITRFDLIAWVSRISSPCEAHRAMQAASAAS
jgi:hypothetical protein